MTIDFKRFMLPGIAALGLIWGCAGNYPGDLGADNGRLKPCPGSPNCVNSQADAVDKTHFIAPLIYSGTTEKAFTTLVSVVKSMAGATITETKENYFRVTFATALMGFVDDAEFYFPEQPVIDVRSASRKGYSDLGINRKRIETIRTLFEKALGQTQP